VWSSVDNIGIGKISARVQKTSYQQYRRKYQQISASIKNHFFQIFKHSQYFQNRRYFANIFKISRYFQNILKIPQYFQNRKYRDIFSAIYRFAENIAIFLNIVDIINTSLEDDPSTVSPSPKVTGPSNGSLRSKLAKDISTLLSKPILLVKTSHIYVFPFNHSSLCL